MDGNGMELSQLLRNENARKKVVIEEMIERKLS